MTSDQLAPNLCASSVVNRLDGTDANLSSPSAGIWARLSLPHQSTGPARRLCSPSSLAGSAEKCSSTSTTRHCIVHPRGAHGQRLDGVLAGSVSSESRITGTGQEYIRKLEGATAGMTDFTDRSHPGRVPTTTSSTNSAPTQGRVGGSVRGATLLCSTTTGAKSGQPRLNPLAYLVIDGRCSSSVRRSTRPPDPHWVHSLRANPTSAHQSWEPESIRRYRIGNCRATNATRCSTRSPPHLRLFAGYQSQTSRVIPLFELTRV